MLNSLFKDKNIPDPYYSKSFGSAFLGDSVEVLKKIKGNSIDLILTSPPFPLKRKKEYGNVSEKEYVNWFLPFAAEFYRILKDSGSLVIDLGGTYKAGRPIKSIYQFELLVALCNDLNFVLAQDLYHYNPARLPTPAEWVTVRRVRVKDSVNVVWWLSKTGYPKANNKKVLKPYSPSMKALLKNGYKPKLRPSGHNISDKFRNNNNGAIPANLLVLANTESNSQYLRLCKEANVKPHPARFPIGFADFFIKLTTDEMDIIIDPFAGSNVTGYAAEVLRRRWIAVELKEEYLIGSQFRFNTSEVRNLKPKKILNLF